MKLNSRARAAQILAQILKDETNLDEALTSAFEKNDQDRGFIQELCYGTLRYYHRLNFFASQLLRKSFSKKDSDLQALVLIGLYQLLYLDTPAYAALSATVEAAKQLQKTWAANLINAVLRNFGRQRETLILKANQNLEAATSHPLWLLKKIQYAFPTDWQTICEANNQQAPLTLRVNAQKISRTDYLKKLQDQNMAAHAAPLSEAGIYLEEAVSVQTLPGFEQGEVSVQDEAAQLAAFLLELKPAQRVLEVGAAPGGKTTHILEKQPEVELTGIDISAPRIKKIHENLQRLQLDAKIICGDATDPASWWDKTLFDRILIDAPCSATGVIRRHPDIKLLREPKNIAELLMTQKKLLDQLWPLLKPKGLLVYATCSILPEENHEQIERFLLANLDAKLVNEKILLPQIKGHDGFYYAVIQR
jgi:16S rRNA (cytosine967-C5)-methyltransferase